MTPAIPRPEDDAGRADADEDRRIDPDELPASEDASASVFDALIGEDVGDAGDAPDSDEEWRDRGGIDEISAPPQPLNFDDGDESRPNGPRPVRDDGTWNDQGADSGRLKPPAEMHTDAPPSAKPDKRAGR